MADDMIIVATREGSSMVSSWTEYLCLTKLTEHRYTLFTGRYEAIAERSEYYNEETEDYDLPELIEGKTVVGLEDDYVVGGELTYYDGSEAVEFTDVDDKVVSAWLGDSAWSRSVDMGAIRKDFRTLSMDR